MSARQHHSEERLAELACAGLRDRGRAAVLIGGLGLGFTLRETLRHVGPDATVVVAELVPAVIDWNRNPAYRLAADVIDDPRVEIVEGAGHFLQLERPDVVNRLVVDWVTSR